MSISGTTHEYHSLMNATAGQSLWTLDCTVFPVVMSLARGDRTATCLFHTQVILMEVSLPWAPQRLCDIVFRQAENKLIHLIQHQLFIRHSRTSDPKSFRSLTRRL